MDPVEERFPRRLPGPGFEQVEFDAPCRGRNPCGNIDEFGPIVAVMALVYLIVSHALCGIAAMALRTAGSIRTVSETFAPALAAAVATGWA